MHDVRRLAGIVSRKEWTDVQSRQVVEEHSAMTNEEYIAVST